MDNKNFRPLLAFTGLIVLSVGVGIIFQSIGIGLAIFGGGLLFSATLTYLNGSDKDW